MHVVYASSFEDFEPDVLLWRDNLCRIWFDDPTDINFVTWLEENYQIKEVPVAEPKPRLGYIFQDAEHYMSILLRYG